MNIFFKGLFIISFFNYYSLFAGKNSKKTLQRNCNTIKGKSSRAAIKEEEYWETYNGDDLRAHHVHPPLVRLIRRSHSGDTNGFNGSS